jgi:hypothetical protein
MNLIYQTNDDYDLYTKLKQNHQNPNEFQRKNYQTKIGNRKEKAPQLRGFNLNY